MSALTKPLIHSTTTVGGAVDPINIENIATLTKITVPDTGSNNNKPLYAINFVLRGVGSGNPTSVKWKWATESARNAAYNAIITLASTAV